MQCTLCVRWLAALRLIDAVIWKSDLYLMACAALDAVLPSDSTGAYAFPCDVGQSILNLFTSEWTKLNQRHGAVTAPFLYTQHGSCLSNYILALPTLRKYNDAKKKNKGKDIELPIEDSPGLASFRGVYGVTISIIEPQARTARICICAVTVAFLRLAEVITMD